MSFAVCTIIARNYLSHARILARSFLETHPDSRFYLVVVDGLPPGVDPGRGITMIHLHELNLPDPAAMAFKYDVTELSTAVKPWLLETLIRDHGEEAVAYLDPDILVTRELTELLEFLNATEIVLVPHLLDPIPLDGMRPSEQDILIAGAYNLGFIALRRGEQASSFLLWWQERLADLCRKSPSEGLMVDQRWIDLVPALFPAATLFRDDTYDVAYWNLHSRELSVADGTFLVNGRPLAFFHFSGFDPQLVGDLSKYQNRHSVSPGSALHSLLSHYAAMHDRAGFNYATDWEYGYHRFQSGKPIHWIARALYSEMTQGERQQFNDPFDDNRPSSYFEWLTRLNASDLSPFLMRLYQLRHDLQRAFPDVTGADRARFLNWAGTQGAKEAGYDPSYVDKTSPDTRRDVANRPAYVVEAGSRPARPFGVNVVGYLRNESGVGAAGRGYVTALRAAGVPVATVDVSDLSPNRSEDSTVDLSQADAVYDINLVAVNADQHFVVTDRLGQGFFADRYTIGVWQWELSSFPSEWSDRFLEYQELWVGTSFIANALAPKSPIPILRIPPPLNPPVRGSRHRGRGRFNLSGDDMLLGFVFDFHSYFDRKNPLAIVAAFRQAFPSGERAKLIIKCNNVSFQPAKYGALQSAVKGDNRISIEAAYWSTEELADFMEACDIYVSLHRSEGIGLTLAHAMALAKPVIATGWSGNTEFMSVANSFLVPFELVPIHEDIGPYRRGELWAEPSVAQAAALMRTAFTDPDHAAALGMRAAADIDAHFSTDAVARLVGHRLDVLHAATTRPRGSAGADRSLGSAIIEMNAQTLLAETDAQLTAAARRLTDVATSVNQA